MKYLVAAMLLLVLAVALMQPICFSITTNPYDPQPINSTRELCLR